MRTIRLAVVRSVMGVCWVAIGTTGLAQMETPAENSLSDSVWYDADKQAAVPIHVRDETQDSVNRDSRWLPKANRLPATKKAGTAPGPAAGATGLFGTDLTFANLFGWVLMTVIVAALIGVFLYVVMNSSMDGAAASKRKRRLGGTALDEQTLERVKHLPAELRRTDVNMRDEAERLMNANQFDQAIILLFGHQLLLLDRAGMLRLNRAKTNGKYFREVRGANSETANRLRKTMDSFERSYFGHHEIAASEFRELWTLNAQIEADVASLEGVAA